MRSTGQRRFVAKALHRRVIDHDLDIERARVRGEKVIRWGARPLTAEA